MMLYFIFLSCTPQEVEEKISDLVVPAGTYTIGPYELGSSRKISNRTIRLSYSFQLEATELTNAQYIEYTGSLPDQVCQRTQKISALSLQHPVSCISWCDTVIVANIRSEQDGLESAYTIPQYFHHGMHETECNEYAQFVSLNLYASGWRLPTEAEWDIAARGWEEEELQALAWYAQNAQGMVHDVATLGPNQQGVFDLRGNVSEWIWEEYGILRKKKTTDPTKKEHHTPHGYARMIKGGDMSSSKEALSLLRRPHASAGLRCDRIGVRMVRTLSRESD